MKKIFPFFSIIIPTFNRVRFLDLAIRSIIRQNFTSYEIIISDNASTDGTKDLVLRYQKQGYPINYFCHKQAVSPQQNVLKGFYLAKGKYAFLLGDDDVILKRDTLQTLQILAKKYNPGFIKISTILYYENLNSINDIYKGFLLAAGIKHISPKNPILPWELNDKYLEFMSGSIYRNDKKFLRFLDHNDVLYFSLNFTYKLCYQYGAVFCGDQFILGRFFQSGHYFYNFIEPKFSLDTMHDCAKQYFQDKHAYQIFDQKLRRAALLHVINWRLIFPPKLLKTYIKKIYQKDKWRVLNAFYYVQALFFKYVPRFLLRFFKKIYILQNKQTIKKTILSRNMLEEIQKYIDLKSSNIKLKVK